MKNLLLAMFVLSMMSTGANAALVATNPTCDNNSAVAQMGAVACSGAWEGNDANQLSLVIAQITSDFATFVPSGSTWAFFEKTDAGQQGNEFSVVPGSSQGTIEFVTAVTDWFVLTLKAGPQFSLYLFDGGANGISSIDFTTIGAATNNNGNALGLSHASLFRYETTSTVEVPVSGTIGLLLLGVFAMVAKRKSRF